jgi:hypothetical protein
MSTAYSGVEGTVEVTVDGTPDTVTDMDVTGHSVDVEDGGFEATTTADGGWQDMHDAIAKASGSFDFFFNPAKNPTSAVVGLMPHSGIYPNLKLKVGGGKFLTGQIKPTKLSFKSAVKEGITLTCSFESKGMWTMPTSP